MDLIKKLWGNRNFRRAVIGAGAIAFATVTGIKLTDDQVDDLVEDTAPENEAPAETTPTTEAP